MSNSELFAPSLGLPKYIHRLIDQQINKTDLPAFQCLGREEPQSVAATVAIRSWGYKMPP